jgi:hypothetical protein
MSTKIGRLAALVMVVMVALTSAGCLNGSSENDNSGSSTGVAIGSSGSGSGGTTKLEKAVKFAECMRANGVGAFPDPDASGDLTLDGVVNGSSVDPDGAAWRQAMSACKDLRPSGFTGTTATPEQQTARLKFAQCIRDNGVKDFPDPTKDSPMIDTNRIPSAASQSGMDALHAAMDKCGDIIASQLGRS